MPQFQYKAIDRNGQYTSGLVDQGTEKDVVQYLESLNLIPVSILLKGKNFRFLGFESIRKNFTRSGKLSSLDITLGLHMLLRSGLPLDKALKSVAATRQDQYSREILTEIENDIREGKSFSDALKSYREDFGDLYISMVRAGEMTGKLDETVGMLAGHLQQSKEFKDNVVTAMIYPVILLLVTLASIVVLMVMVMPRFKELFADMGGQVPALTQVFISLSDLMIDAGPYVMVLCILVLSSFLVLKNNNSFRDWADKNMLLIPVLGDLVRKIEITNFSMMLSMLMKNGVSIQKSLLVSADALSNRYLKKQINEKSQYIREGKSFSHSMANIFPSMTQQIIKMAEEASDLENALGHISNISREELNRNLKRFLGVLEPMIIVVLGLIVAAVIGSIMVAVLSMNDLVLM